MTWWHKFGLAMALAFTGKNALATGASVVVAGVTAVQLGVDPWPWVIGAMGSTVVYAHKRGATAAHSLSNGVISLLMAGLGAPYAGVLVGKHVGEDYANTYVLAAILSAAWPWLLPFAWGLIRGRVTAKVGAAETGGNKDA